MKYEYETQSHNCHTPVLIGHDGHPTLYLEPSEPAGSRYTHNLTGLLSHEMKCIMKAFQKHSFRRSQIK